MEIWGFSGKLSTGKNYVSERIFLPMLDEKKTICLAFANHFKIDAIVKQGLDRNKVFGKKDDHTRRVLQIMGTEEGRNKYGENIWVNLAEEWRAYYENLGYERAIVFDVRFPNEVDYIKKAGGKVIRIESPMRHLAGAQKEAEANGVDVNLIMGHASETSLDGYENFDLVVKNDPLDQPIIQIRNYVREHNENNKPEHVFFLDMDDTICHCHSYYEEVIDKVEATFDFVKEKYNFSGLQVHDIFRTYIRDMRHRHNTEIYNRSRFPEDLVWAVQRTFKSLISIYDEFKSDPHVTSYKFAAMKEALRLGYTVFDYPYSPLPGALEAIEELRKKGKVVIFTLGDRLEQVKKLAGLGLTDLDFVITHAKNKMTWTGLLRKFPAHKHWMVGDNLACDILASHEAGVTPDRTYFVNHPDRKFVTTDDVKPYQTVEALTEAVRLISLHIDTDTLAARQILAKFVDNQMVQSANIIDGELMGELPDSKNYSQSIEGVWDNSVNPPVYMGAIVTRTPLTEEENK